MYPGLSHRRRIWSCLESMVVLMGQHVPGVEWMWKRSSPVLPHQSTAGIPTEGHTGPDVTTPQHTREVWKLKTSGVATLLLALRHMQLTLFMVIMHHWLIWCPSQGPGPSPQDHCSASQDPACSDIWGSEFRPRGEEYPWHKAKVVIGTLCPLFSSPADPDRRAALPWIEQSPRLGRPQTSHAAPQNEQPDWSSGNQTGVFICRLFLTNWEWFSDKEVSAGSFILFKYTESPAPQLHKVSGSCKVGEYLSRRGWIRTIIW